MRRPDVEFEFDAYEDVPGPDGTVEATDFLLWDTGNQTLHVGDTMPRIRGRYFNAQTGEWDIFDTHERPNGPILALTPTIFTDESVDCMRQAHAAEAIHLEEKGLTVVHFSLQTKEALRRVAEENDITHPLVSLRPDREYNVPAGQDKLLGVGITPVIHNGEQRADAAYWGDFTQPNVDVNVTARAAFVGTAVNNVDGMRRGRKLLMVHRVPDQAAALPLRGSEGAVAIARR